MKILVDGAETEVDITFDSMTLREQILFQRSLGTERYHEWVASAGWMEPDVIHALIFVALRRTHPNVGPEDFDVDSAEVLALLNVEVEANPTSGS